MFDKRIPVALIFTFIMTFAVQSAAAIWWLSSISSEVANQNQRLVAIEATRAGERLAVLESTIGDVRAQLNRIEAKLDRYAEQSKSHP